MNVVEIKNNTETLQVALVDGKQFVFKPFESRTLSPSMAQELSMSNPHLELVIDEEDLYDEISASPDKVFLANVTGNPDFPDEIEDLQYDKLARQNKLVKIPNPKKQPHNFKVKMDLGQVTYKAKNSTWSKNLGKVPIVVPAYEVKAFEPGVAKFLLNRSHQCEKKHQGKLIRSRAKPVFWPDHSWDYEEIQLFLKLHEPSADLGIEPEKFDILDEVEQYDAKEALIKRLFFVYADPKRKIFNRREFKQFLKAQEPDKQEVKKAAKDAVKKALK